MGPRIQKLRDEAGEHGDLGMVAICDRALRGDAFAIGRCIERIIEGAAALPDRAAYDAIVSAVRNDCARAAAAAFEDEAPGEDPAACPGWTTESWKIDGSPGRWADYHDAVVAEVQRLRSAR